MHLAHRSPAQQRGSIIRLVGAGLALELVLAAGFLWPLSLWKLPEAIDGYQPLATAFGVTRAGAARLLLALIGAGLAFGLAVWCARGLRGSGVHRLILAGTVLSALTLLPTNPAGSQDLYHNIADARTLWVYGDNPAATAPSAHADDPFFQHVAAWSEHPSAYGPLWYVVAGAPLPLAGDAFWPNVIGQKALTALFLLALTWLCMSTAEGLRRGTGVLAGVLVGWNPLLLFETAGNGHNDVVMMTFAAAVLWAAVRGRWLWVFPLLALAIATKHVTVILGPILLLWMLRRPDIPRRTIGISLLVGIALTAALYAPYLVGGDVLRTVQTDSGRMVASPGTAVVGYLMNNLGLAQSTSVTLMKLIFGSAFLYAYARLLLRSGRNEDPAVLVERCFWAMLLFLVLLKWWFWPWYVFWAAPLGALLPRGRAALVGAVFSLFALLMYVTYYWQLYDGWYQRQTTTVLAVFLAPLVVALASDIRRNRQHRVPSLTRAWTEDAA